MRFSKFFKCTDHKFTVTHHSNCSHCIIGLIFYHNSSYFQRKAVKSHCQLHSWQKCRQKAVTNNLKQLRNNSVSIIQQCKEFMKNFFCAVCISNLSQTENHCMSSQNGKIIWMYPFASLTAYIADKMSLMCCNFLMVNNDNSKSFDFWTKITQECCK